MHLTCCGEGHDSRVDIQLVPRLLCRIFVLTTILLAPNSPCIWFKQHMINFFHIYHKQKETWRNRSLQQARRTLCDSRDLPKLNTIHSKLQLASIRCLYQLLGMHAEKLSRAIMHASKGLLNYVDAFHKTRARGLYTTPTHAAM